MMSFGNKIRQARHDKNIKQQNLAKHLNITQGTLSKIENDNLCISADDLLKVAAYTKTPVLKLLPDNVQTELQNDYANIISTHDQKDQAFHKRIIELEDLVTDLKSRNQELQDKIKRRDLKIEELKMKYAQVNNY